MRLRGDRIVSARARALHQGRCVARGRGTALCRGGALAEPLPKEEPVGEKTLTAAMVSFGRETRDEGQASGSFKFLEGKSF